MRRTTCKIFSDASFDQQTGKCGYGVAIVLRDLCILKYGSIRGAKSSCEAELLAAKKGIDYLNTKEFLKLGRTVTKVVVFSDNFCVRSIDQRNTDTLDKWERSENKGKKRLANIARSMKAGCHKYARGCETWHITGHTCGDPMDGEYENRKLEYHYNNWCDQSARKNLRYDLRGKKIIRCKGFADAYEYNVEVPEGAFQAWKEKMASKNENDLQRQENISTSD